MMIMRILSAFLLVLVLAACSSAPLADTSPTTPVQPAPIDSEMRLPESVESAILQDATQRSGLTIDQLTITQSIQKTWSDGCLGLGGPETLCMQVLVLGWEVTVEGNENRWVYRTNESGSVLALDEEASLIK